MKQRCPRCESWSAEGATACPCGHQFVQRGVARLHRAPAPPVDPSLVTDLRLRSRKDIRNGVVTLCILLPLTAVVLFLGGRVGILVVGGLFWAGVVIVRGLRLRREAWEAEATGR